MYYSMYSASGGRGAESLTGNDLASNSEVQRSEEATKSIAKARLAVAHNLEHTLVPGSSKECRAPSQHTEGM